MSTWMCRNSAFCKAFGGTNRIGCAAVKELAIQAKGLNNVPGDVCQSLDIQYDDGVFNTGSIRRAAAPDEEL
ncbi:MAG TPA: hypothetical protein VLH56_17700 [Dissulfurispiraceae bacterium]|nr:hypothetical protein [Dissulfurispiraceae bacterium]